MNYSAKYFYMDPRIVDGYEADRFSSRMGRYRYRREQRGVAYILNLVPEAQLFFDCPVGIGRWSEVLIEHGHTVIGADISPAMLKMAGKRNTRQENLVGLSLADAEHLPLAAKSVDYAFCHALLKHLPMPVQLEVLDELARVTRHGFVVSISVLAGLPALVWRLRGIEEAYGLSKAEIASWAANRSMEVRASRKCTTPVGVERSILFEHRKAPR